MKRFVALLMVLVLCFGICEVVGAEDTRYADAELDRAVQLGFGTYRSDDPALTIVEYIQLLDHAMSVLDGAKLDVWLDRLPLARTSELIASRFDGMLGILFFAETLGGDYLNFNADWGILVEKIGNDTVWDGVPDHDEIMDSEHRVREGFENAPYVFEDSFNMKTLAMFYNYGRISFQSGECLFSYSPVENSTRPAVDMTYTDALRAIIRLNDSVTSLRVADDAERDILRMAEERKLAIRNSATDVNVVGKKYYVSNDGDDTNDGLSPESAWATLDKVNSASPEVEYMTKRVEYAWARANRSKRAKLRPGDGVFFKRGDFWRGVLRGAEGVTYSAYGEGEKPVICASPENGSGKEKWLPVPETPNTWVFYRDMEDCGAILLNGETVANKYIAYWTGKRYVDTNGRNYLGADLQYDIDQIMRTPFDYKTSLPDLWFFNDIHYKKQMKVDYENVCNKGKLYLRCDAGNPGEIYETIEFNYGSYVALFKSDTVVDNLQFIHGGGGVHAGGNANVTIQNCVVGWIGGTILTFGGEIVGFDGLAINRHGDAIAIGGRNNSAVNNYVYQIWDGALMIESNNDFPYVQSDCIFKGNIAEYTSGIAVTDWYDTHKDITIDRFRNMTIDNNYILFTGQADWVHPIEKMTESYATSAIELNMPKGENDVRVVNNVFYKSYGTCPLVALLDNGQYGNSVIFAGNTYVQDNFCPIFTLSTPDSPGERRIYYTNFDAEQTMKEILGDTEAVVLPLSFHPYGATN